MATAIEMDTEPAPRLWTTDEFERGILAPSQTGSWSCSMALLLTGSREDRFIGPPVIITSLPIWVFSITSESN